MKNLKSQTTKTKKKTQPHSITHWHHTLCF